MKCIQCNKEFEAKRSTAKFDTAACKKAYQRGISGTKPLAGQVNSVPLTKEPEWIPAWKRNGFKSKEEALNFVIATIEDRAKHNALLGSEGEASWFVKGVWTKLTKRGFEILGQ